METLTYRNVTIKIKEDIDPVNPRREWDNFGTMACFHPRYNLGDADHGFTDPQHLIVFLTENKDKYVYLPLFLYDHSGISISVKNVWPYKDQWDSMMVGFIYAETDSEEVKAWTKEWKEQNYPGKTDREIIHEIFVNEVTIYNHYISGNVYCYDIPETRDSCGGFYGTNWQENGLLEYARNAIDCYLQEKAIQEHKQRLSALKKAKSDFAFKRRKKAVRIA
jgi:hypothetical protein